jgi:hypothetical protein
MYALHEIQSGHPQAYGFSFLLEQHTEVGKDMKGQPSFGIFVWKHKSEKLHIAPSCVLILPLKWQLLVLLLLMSRADV